MSSPAVCTRPCRSPPWKCGTRPSAARSSVDLPDPEPPTSSTSWPAPICRSTPSSAGAVGARVAVGHALEAQRPIAPSRPRRRAARASAAARRSPPAAAGRRACRSSGTPVAPVARPAVTRAVAAAPRAASAHSRRSRVPLGRPRAAGRRRSRAPPSPRPRRASARASVASSGPSRPGGGARRGEPGGPRARGHHDPAASRSSAGTIRVARAAIMADRGRDAGGRAQQEVGVGEAHEGRDRQRRRGDPHPGARAVGELLGRDLRVEDGDVRALPEHGQALDGDERVEEEDDHARADRGERVEAAAAAARRAAGAPTRRWPRPSHSGFHAAIAASSGAPVTSAAGQRLHGRPP